MVILMLYRVSGTYDGRLEVEDKVALIVYHEYQGDKVERMEVDEEEISTCRRWR
jgi:hypothetical protein